MRKSFLSFMLPLLIISTGSLGAPSQAADEAAVRSVVMQQAGAWNKHDAAAYSALFTPDCDVVNVVGWWWRVARKCSRNSPVRSQPYSRTAG